jgi:hypothetical protein
MSRIARRAIGADRRPRTNGRAIATVEAIMAGLAEAAERAEPEGVVVASVWFESGTVAGFTRSASRQISHNGSRRS